MLGEAVTMLGGERLTRNIVCSVVVVLLLSGCSTFRTRAGDLPFPERPRLAWSLFSTKVVPVRETVKNTPLSLTINTILDAQGEAYCVSQSDAGLLDRYLRQVEALREANR